MCNWIRDNKFNSNPGGKVRRNDFCALLFRSGVYKYIDKMDGASIQKKTELFKSTWNEGWHNINEA